MAVTRRHRGVFGRFLAHRKRVRVAHHSYLTTWGVSPEFFEKIAIYWFLEGSGHLEKFRAPTDKKTLTPKKSKKKLKILFFVAVSKNKFSSKTERFFFVFGPWRPL